METKIINKFDYFENFVMEYFKNSKTFGVKKHYSYDGSETEIYIKGTGFLFGYQHRVARVYNRTVTLFDHTYYSDIVDMINRYEKNHGNTIVLNLEQHKL